MTPTMHRRGLLRAGAAAGLYAAVRPLGARAQTPIALSMTSWGAPAELEGFNALVAKYKELRPNVSVRLDVVPSGQYYQQLDTRLAGRQAPDLFRAQYQQIGRYAQSGAAIDLSPYVDQAYGEAFLPSVWKAVILQGKVHALPHHTDTFALYYNVDFLRNLGFEMPRSLDHSLKWDEFIRIARQLKEKGDGPYGFAMGWQNSSAYRWLPCLYQVVLAGRRLGHIATDQVRGFRRTRGAGMCV